MTALLEEKVLSALRIWNP